MPDIFALTPGALTKLLFADPTGPHAGAFNIQHPDKARQDEAILSRRQAMIAAAKLLWPIPDKGLRHRLYRIQAPTIVIGGTRDELMGEAYIRDFAKGIAGARVQMLDAGHMVPQEATMAVAASISKLSQKVPA
jgi:pimeloyl-ACP methyl ester carboxylesterase